RAGAAWPSEWSGTGLYALAGSSSTDLWAFGEAGLIVHGNGTAWSTVASPTTATMFAAWTTSASDVWAAGDGTVLHWHGTQWSAQNLTAAGLSDQLGGIWASGPDDVWAVGSEADSTFRWKGVIYHFDGSRWSKMITTTGQFASIWGSSRTNVWTSVG